MPFTMPNFPLLSKEQINPYGNTIENLLKGYTAATQARYLPRMTEAEIFGKQAGPLATIASNPFIWATMSEQQKKALGEKITQLLGGMGGGNDMGTGGGFFGGGGQSSGFGGLSGLFGGGTQQGGTSYFPEESGTSGTMPQGGTGNGYQLTGQDVMQGRGQNIQGNVPSNLPSGSTSQRVSQKTMAPLANTQLYPAGTVYVDEKGKQRVTSSATTLNNAQVGMGAAQISIPLLEKLQKEGDEVLKQGRWFKLLSSIAASAGETAGIKPSTLKKFGIDSSYYKKWLQFIKDQNDAAAKLAVVYNYGNNIEGHNTARSQVAPEIFEGGTSYRDRLQNEIEKIKYQNAVYAQQQREPFNVEPGAPVQIPESSYSSNVGNGQGVKLLAKDVVIPEFDSKKEAMDWYGRQTDFVKKAIRKKLGAT